MDLAEYIAADSHARHASVAQTLPYVEFRPGEDF